MVQHAFNSNSLETLFAHPPKLKMESKAAYKMESLRARQSEKSLSCMKWS